MKSEAELTEHPVGRCNKDPDCKQHCPKCVSCNCIKHICICEKLPLGDDTPPF